MNVNESTQAVAGWQATIQSRRSRCAAAPTFGKSFYAGERNHVNINGSTQAEAGQRATAELEIVRSRRAAALTLCRLFPYAVVDRVHHNEAIN